MLQRHHRFLFYSAWLLLGLLQAVTTELQDDEAYYWVYSKYPDWGYFDHPPLIALLIRAGSVLIPGELGVRLFPLILNVAAIFIIETLTSSKNPKLFYTIALSLGVLQLAGFLAVPDTPLLFAAALFFLSYRSFLVKGNISSATLLGVAAAILLYSKYHGALVILFTVISNPGLFKTYRIYFAGLVCLLLFSPHLLWQLDHNWISFRYHLFESNVNEYKPGITINYIAGLFLLTGPVAGLILLPAAFRYRPADVFERALKFTMVGIYAFFLASSFRGKVEMNWTLPAIVPLVLLSHLQLEKWQRWRIVLTRLLPFSLLIVLTARIIMIVDLLPVDSIRKRYHAWKEWPGEMKIKTASTPVVFSNSYQRASKYWFYTGQVTHSQNLYKEHRNQYNFWPVEDSLLNRTVHYLDIYDLHRFPDSLATPLGFIGYQRIDTFISLSKVEFREISVNAAGADSATVRAKIRMPGHYRRMIESNSSRPARLIIAFFKSGKWHTDLAVPISLALLLNEEVAYRIPKPASGKYTLLLALQVGPGYPTHASDKIKVRFP